MAIILLYLWVVPKLVGNDSLYVHLANMVQEISLFLVFNMALAAILKMGYQNTFPPLLGGAWGLIFLQIGFSYQINKETKVQKNWSRILRK